MNKFYSLATMSLLAMAGLVAQGAEEARSVAPSVMKGGALQENSRTGAEMVVSIRKNYEAGAYEPMLAGLEHEYQQMVQEGRFEEFSCMRGLAVAGGEEAAFATRWEELSQRLVNERNGELKELLKEVKQPLMERQINSVITALSPEQKEALQYLSSLRVKSLDQAVNSDEKKLIEIDLDTEFKALQLEAQSTVLPASDRMEKQIVLKMDMLKRMQKAAASFKDQELKKKIDAATGALDAWHARFWDMTQLKVAAKKSSNDVEKKLATILSSHKTKESDLYRAELGKLSQH